MQYWSVLWSLRWLALGFLAAFAWLEFTVDLCVCTPWFLMFLSAAELFILLFGLHDLLVVHLNFLFLLSLEADSVILLAPASLWLLESASENITFIKSLQWLLAEMECAIFPNTKRVLMIVDTTIVQIKPQFLFILLLLILLNVVIMHELLVAARWANNTRNTVLLFRFLLSFQGFLPHALLHFEWDVDLPCVILADALLLAWHVGVVVLANLFEESL